MAATQFATGPSFDLQYEQKIPANFGEGYAEGIKSAAGSIAGAIGQVAHVADQNRTANDVLTQLSQTKDSEGNPILSEEDYNNIMKKGLGAKQQYMGEVFSRFHDQYSSMLDQRRQIAVAQASAAAAAPYRMAEISATGAQELARLREAERLRQQSNPDQRLVEPAPAKKETPPAAGADKITSPLKMTLDAAKSNSNVLNLFPNMK